jgi:hypothetical protein
MVFEIHTLWIHSSSALLVGYVRNSGGKNKKEEITHVSNFNEKIIRSWSSDIRQRDGIQKWLHTSLHQEMESISLT